MDGKPGAPSDDRPGGGSGGIAGHNDGMHRLRTEPADNLPSEGDDLLGRPVSVRAASRVGQVDKPRRPQPEEPAQHGKPPNAGVEQPDTHPGAVAAIE